MNTYISKSPFRNLASGLVLVSSLATFACGGKEPTCENVVDHTLGLMPAEFKKQMGDKKVLIEQCEKETTEEQRKCALEAKDMEALMKCK